MFYSSGSWLATGWYSEHMTLPQSSLFWNIWKISLDYKSIHIIAKKQPALYLSTTKQEALLDSLHKTSIDANFVKGSVAGWIMISPHHHHHEVIHIFIPGMCGYVTLHGKRDSADVTELGILRWEDYPWWAGWAQWNHRSQEGQSQKEAWWLKRLCFEDSQRGHESRNAGSL